MSSPSQQQLIHYLQTDLGVSEKAIDLALRLQQPLQGSLHILLWQYGLINIEQLGKAIEWLMTERGETTSKE
ncbi:DUF2949 domain-containing protein [Acaryochloris marina]|uniref:DUF2949 domain-containing protein n=1 Tax=Acaryochloris marina (strain MBIC 11017) TaxID=329726 RepID=A8ZKA9_ACAM1|nr:DUF2949 domain-containing protein [Acaryochloris marina]ABW31610.1 conserved hypothetical protein [Acaryochloris marina MBIC11017]